MPEEAATTLPAAAPAPELAPEPLDPKAAALLKELDHRTKIDELYEAEKGMVWQRRLSLDETELLRQHVFCRKFELLDYLDLTAAFTLRGSDGAHAGISLLCSAYRAGFISLSILSFGKNRVSDLDGVLLLDAMIARGEEGAGKMTKLFLEGNEIGDKTVQLLSSGAFGELSYLKLDDNKIGDAGALALANCDWPMLRHVQLKNNVFDDESVERLAESAVSEGSGLGAVSYLTIDSFDFAFYDLRNKETIVRIGGAPTKLDLAGVDDQGKARSPMSDRDVKILSTALAVPGILPKLDLLLLHTNELGAQAMASLAWAMPTSDALKNLGQLHLTNNRIGDIGLRQLMNPVQRDSAACLPKLRELHIAGNGITDKGASTLSEALSAGGLPLLKLLSASQNQIGDDGCAALATAMKGGAAPKLAGLYLGRNAIGDRGAAAMAQMLESSSAVPMMEQLYIFGNQLTIEGHSPLARAAAKRKELALDTGVSVELEAVRVEEVVVD